MAVFLTVASAVEPREHTEGTPDATRAGGLTMTDQDTDPVV